MICRKLYLPGKYEMLIKIVLVRILKLVIVFYIENRIDACQ